MFLHVCMALSSRGQFSCDRFVTAASNTIHYMFAIHLMITEQDSTIYIMYRIFMTHQYLTGTLTVWLTDICSRYGSNSKTTLF